MTGYASSIQYAAHGAMTSLTLGNNVMETRGYNARLQPTTVNAEKDQTTLLALTNTYSATANNGNVQSQQISPLGVTQSFSYDGANRISGASEGSNWSQTYGHDRFGNHWVSAWSWVTLSSFTPTSSTWFDTANRLVNAGLGITHDGSGNLATIGGYTQAYNAENLLRQSTINSTATTYDYDGEGRRVKKTTGSTNTVYVHDAFGQLAAEYSTQAEAGGRQYITVDHLGSTRLLTNEAGQLAKRYDYLPYGEELTGIGGRTTGAGFNAAPTAFYPEFTGKERDAETGLDYFGARYFSGAQGRFTSPDPIHILKQKIRDPQQWNMYSYARNNPLRFFDPTGMYVADCNSDVKNCKKEIEKFEKTRLKALKSKDDKIRAAAAAYGALGDKNGVNLTVAKVVDAKHPSVVGQVTEQAGTGGFTFENGKFQQATQVTIKAGLGGRDLLAAAVHEGVHVQDRARFVGTMQLAEPQFNPRLNILSITSERNAYGVENLLLRSLGLPERNIDEILSRPPYSDSPTIRLPLFPGLPTEDLP
ncbi:MAG: RHS repeat-associated core domain-containing protein [Candidatus Hydrogenedentes bacterium]|nr:RHS repeat-associated core domain-containing protein [Candidatus Hydrogenedentota bacterium]